MAEEAGAADAGGAGEPDRGDDEAAATGRLPPGQRVARDWPILHYGPVPRTRLQSWDLHIFGATAAGSDLRWSMEEFARLPHRTVLSDLHCVTKFSVMGIEWSGVPCAEVLGRVPPSEQAGFVMAWAEYGYSANLRMDDLRHPDALLATHRDGRELSAERGGPCRLILPHLYAWKGPKWIRGFEYLTEDRRGFWEERGYHNRGEAFTEQRYSHQECPDGDALTAGSGAPGSGASGPVAPGLGEVSPRAGRWRRQIGRG